MMKNWRKIICPLMQINRLLMLSASMAMAHPMWNNSPDSSNSTMTLSLNSCFNACATTTVDAFKSLPNEIETMFYQYLGSFKDIASCSQVCKRWSTFIRSNLVDFSFYTSRQDFLERAVQDSLVQPISPMVLQNIVSSEAFQPVVCSVSYSFWIQTNMKFGFLSILEKEWHRVEPNVAEASDYLNEILRGFSSMDSEWEFAEMVLMASLEWTRQASLRHERFHMQSRLRSILMEAFKRDIAFIYQHDVLSRLRNTLDIQSSGFLLAASQGHSQLMKQLLSEIHAIETQTQQATLISGLSQCRTCDQDDVQGVYALVPFNQQSGVYSHILLGACQYGNLHMFDLILTMKPRLRYGYSEFIFAIQSGNVQLVQRFAHSPTHFHLHYHHLQGLVRGSSINSLAVFDDFIQNQEGFQADEAQELIDFYAKKACGSRSTMASFKKLAHVRGIELHSTHLMSALDRLDFKPSQFDMPKGSIWCRKNESTQLIDYLLTETRIIPNQDHLNLALERGRLDIVKRLYDAGKEKGASLTLNASHLFMLVRSLDSFHFIKHSYQEVHLIDYILNEINRNSGEISTEKVVLNDFITYLQHATRGSLKPFDCYYHHAKKRLGIE